MDTCILNDMLAHYDLHNYRVMPDNFCLIRDIANTSIQSPPMGTVRLCTGPKDCRPKWSYIKVIKGLCMVWQYRSLLHLTETPSHTDQATRTLLRDSTNHTIIVSICSLHLHITHSMKYLNHISLFIIPVPICNKNTTYPLISCTDEQHQHNSCEI